MTISNKGAEEALKGIPSPVNLQLHTGNPGAEGKANVAAENTRKAASIGAYEAGKGRKTTLAVEWAEVKAKETYAFVSLWEVETFLGYFPLTEPVAVEAGDTFKIPAGSLVLQAE